MVNSKDILWLKVSDEVSIPGVLLGEEAARLIEVFSSQNPESPWNLALGKMGMTGGPALGETLRVQQGIPYFNGSLLTRIVSHGTVIVRCESSLKIVYESQFSPIGILRMLRTQWRLENFLSNVEARPVPDSDAARIQESVLLGLVLQTLMLRLPARSEADFAQWLSNPPNAPATARKTVERILKIQNLRTRLSPAWNSLWAGKAKRPDGPPLPSFFWNELPPDAPTSTEEPVEFSQVWKGLSICPGEIEGNLVLIDKIPFNTPDPLPPLPRVLVFPRAHPDTTLLFADSSAVIFAEGGALSHACCVAREQNLPCISGLGKNFLSACREAQKKAGESGKNLRVRFNGSTAAVELLPEN